MQAISAYYWDEKAHTKRKASFLKYGEVAFITASPEQINAVLMAVVTAIRCGKCLDMSHTDRRRDIIVFTDRVTELKELNTITKEMAKGYGKTCKGHLRVIPVPPCDGIEEMKNKIEAYEPDFVFIADARPYVAVTYRKSWPYGFLSQFCQMINKMGITAMIGYDTTKSGSNEYLYRYMSMHGNNHYFLNSEWANIMCICGSGETCVRVFYRPEPYPVPLAQGELFCVDTYGYTWNITTPIPKCEMVKRVCQWCEITHRAGMLKIQKAIEYGLIKEVDGMYVACEDAVYEDGEGIWRFRCIDYNPASKQRKRTKKR